MTTKRSDDEWPLSDEEWPLPDERIADAIGELGSDKEPPAGWEQRVADATTVNEMSTDYLARVRRLVDHRLNRLFRLFALDAPPALIAQELTLVGSTAAMFDPHGVARRDAEATERKARTLVGLCARSSCPHEPAEGMLEYDSEYCDAHAAQLRADTAYDDGGTYGVPS